MFKVYDFPAITPPEDLVQALRVREPDWDINKDGLALADQFWRWHGHVEPHTDDVDSDDLILGYVFDAHGHWLVQDGKALTLQPGSVYLLDPHQRHGVLAPDRSGYLICRVTSISFAQRNKLDLDPFIHTSIRQAWDLVRSPIPENSLI